MTTKKDDQGTLTLSEKPTNSETKQKETAKVPEKKAEQNEVPAIPKKLVEAGLLNALISPKKAFIESGGTKEQFTKEVNFAMQALMDNDYLLQCAKSYPDHLVEAIKNVGLTGLTLNPTLKLGYLVPYKGKIKFQPSYMGKREIVNRSGAVKDSYAVLVREKDKFEMAKGTEGYIKHTINPFVDRGELLGGYWVCELTNGAKSFDAMPKERIEEIKSRSESVKSGKQSPWDSDFNEMATKTIYNWGFKFMPKTGLSEDQVKALEIDSDIDRDQFEDWKKHRESGAKDRFSDDSPINFDDAQVIN